MDHPVSKLLRCAPGAVLLLTIPATAWADPGLPMLVLVWPASVFVLGPIIAVEAWYGQKLGFSREVAWKVATKANIVSTLGGIPLAWLGMLALQFLTTYPLVAAGVSLPRAVWYYGIYWTLGAAWLAP